MSSVKEQSKVLDGYAFGELIRSSTRGLALNVDLINALINGIDLYEETFNLSKEILKLSKIM